MRLCVSHILNWILLFFSQEDGIAVVCPLPMEPELEAMSTGALLCGPPLMFSGLIPLKLTFGWMNLDMFLL